MKINMEGGMPKEYSASDMQVAEFMRRHLDEPCLAGTPESNLALLLEEARTALATMRNPRAIQMLNEAIQKHEKNERNI